MSERRVYVGYDKAIGRVERLQPVLEAILAADAIIAWTQPMRRDELEP